MKFLIKSKRQLLISIVIFNLLCIFYVQKAYAEGLSLSVSPEITHITMADKSQAKISIILENKSLNQLQLDVLFKPFKAADTLNGKISYLNSSESSDYDRLFENIHLFDTSNEEITNLNLSPQQKK